MANDVFANGLEIACKAADGKSIAAFPDPCWSPPTPTAGYIVIPYANTTFAKDTANASKTVFITNKPVMKKDVSYFKTSTGNEPATGPKGVVTGVKKGKAYFVSWSMNVKVEGKNVDRHTDSMTHNHGSMAGNTGVWKYIDTATRRNACKDDFKKVQKKCKPMKKGTKGKRKGKQVFNKTKGAWKEKYCKGLQAAAPTKDDFSQKELKERLEKMTDTNKIVADTLQKAKDYAKEKAIEIIEKKAAKVLAKSLIKGWLGPIGWAWTAYDVISTGFETADLYKKLNELQKDIDKLNDTVDKVKALADKDTLEARDIADAQTLIANANPCLRARKCMLVPYQKSQQAGSSARDGNSGCCKGQTAHHVIPKSQFLQEYKKGEKRKKISDCPKYSEKKAPCICVEGTSHSRGGTHESIHTNLESRIENGADSKGEWTYAKARDESIKSVKSVAPQCSSACLKAQLDNYHKQACQQSGDNFKLRSASAQKNKTHIRTRTRGED